MHVQPDKVTINKKEAQRVADLYKMNATTQDSHHGNEGHLATKSTAESKHQPGSHRPRQLSGRHH